MVFRVVAADAAEGFALIGMAGDDRAVSAAEVRGRAGERIEPQIRLAFGGVGAVAFKTGVGQDRADVAVEEDLVRPPAPRRRTDGQHREGRPDEMTIELPGQHGPPLYTNPRRECSIGRNPKSSCEISLLPASVNSVPIGCAFSKPGI